MHEHGGVNCKYAVFWKIGKFAEPKKTNRLKLEGLGKLTHGLGLGFGGRPLGLQIWIRLLGLGDADGVGRSLATRSQRGRLARPRSRGRRGATAGRGRGQARRQLGLRRRSGDLKAGTRPGPRALDLRRARGTSSRRRGRVEATLSTGIHGGTWGVVEGSGDGDDGRRQIRGWGIHSR